jgi:hypothetical protein
MADFTFPNPVPLFPTIPGITFSIHKRPTWATIEFVAVSGRRVSSPQQAYPLWEIELTFDFLKDETQNIVPYQAFANRHDFTQLSQLFLACAGKYGQFYFNDPTDNSRIGQFLCTGDGVTTSFPVLRTWGFNGLELLEPVGGVNELLAAYDNGVTIPLPYYTVSGNTLVFNTPPASGHTITVDLTFYYLCQFLEDQHDYEQFMYNLWTLRSCKLRSVKQ